MQTSYNASNKGSLKYEIHYLPNQVGEHNEMN